MKKTIISLDLIEVASPCQVPWETMIGDDRTRFCGECKLNVYNLSGMSRDEAEALVNARDGRLCVRFFRRPDGTVLTQDCPVGLRAVRRRMAKMVAAIAAMVSFLSAGLLAARTTPSQQNANAGASRGPVARIVEWLDPSTVTAGWAIAGDMCLPTPPPPTNPPQATPTE